MCKKLKEMIFIALIVVTSVFCARISKSYAITSSSSLIYNGIDVSNWQGYINYAEVKDAGIEVSLFIDPTEEQVKASAQTGAQFIEMHTGQYSNAFGTDKEEVEFEKLYNSAKLAQSLGLRVNAGHGLNYENVSRMHEIEGLYELNIGHSIISKAVFTGLAQATAEMKELIK